MWRHMFEKGFGLAERLDCKAGGLKKPDDGLPNRLVIIDKTNNGRNITHPFSLACQRGAAQSDLSPGSDRRRSSRVLQYYHYVGHWRYAELAHQMRAMSLDCLCRHSKLTSDLFIEHSSGDELHHLVLARR